MHKRLYLYGAMGHAKVVADAAAGQGYEIAGYIDDFAGEERRVNWDGAPIIGLGEVPPGSTVFPAFGNCEARNRVGGELLKRGFAVPAICHKTASVSPWAEIGAGVFVGANATVDPGCVIGNFAIVNNNSAVCHDSKVGAACTICPGVFIAGGVTLGEESWLGIGCCVKEKIVIGRNVFVGAGSVVVSPLPDRVMAYGVPAKIQKKMP